MFERFTDRAKKVMSCARQAAQRLNHEYVGTEHLLMGIMDERSGGVAATVLNDMVGHEKIRHELQRMVEPGSSELNMALMPLSPGAKRTLELSMEEASAFRHDYIGTEHLLLGLIRQREGIAAQVLARLGVNLDEMRAEILAYLGAVGESAATIQEPGIKVDGRRVTCRLVWTFWYDNGQKQSEGGYVNGKRHGQWTFWNEDGSIDEERTGYYEEGKSNGK